MKRVPSVFLFLLFSLCGSMSVMAQDFQSLRNKVEGFIQAKGIDTKFIRRQEMDNEIVYQWGSVKDGVRLSIFYGASEKEAADKMNTSISHISVSPDRKLTGVGDEAYFWKSHEDSFAAIRFRKSNVYVDLVAPSITMAQDLASKLAVLIAGK